MARKTISIDAEAYRRLKLAQRDDESLSDTIKRVVVPAMPLGSWLASVGDVEFSDDFVRAVEEQIASRSVPSRRFGRPSVKRSKAARGPRKRR